jgi:hypothetical protein
MLVLVATLALGTSARGDVKPGEPVDVAAFGFCWKALSQDAPRLYEPALNDSSGATSVDIAENGTLEVEWRHPRDVRKIVLTGSKLPSADKILVYWWYSIWPDNGSGGWQRLDDPYNGTWIRLDADISSSDGRLTWDVKPLTKAENPKIEHEGAEFRRTYKIRLVFSSKASVSALETYTDAIWRTADIRMDWAAKTGGDTKWSGRVEARNARLLECDTSGPVRVKVAYAHAPDRLSHDRGIIVFRTDGWKSFSVFVDDVVSKGGIYVRDIDAFVSDETKKLTYSTWKKPSYAWDATIMAKVGAMPEQSLQRVMQHIPAKPPREAHLGVANLRQEFTITASGNVQCQKESLRSPGSDTERRAWDVWSLDYVASTDPNPTFSADGARQTTRYLEDGYLPVIHSEWNTGDLKFHKSAYATTLLEKIGDNEDTRRGDETLILLERIEIENAGNSSQTAHYWIELTLKTPMELEDDGLIRLTQASDGKDRPGLTPTRGILKTNGKGKFEIVEGVVPAAPGSPDPEIGNDEPKPRTALHYEVTLAPGEKHVVYMNVPYIECLNEQELAEMRKLTYEDRHAEVVDYWNKRFDTHMKYEVPEPVLNNLFKANHWHTLITTDRDPETGLYEHGAATMHYYVYANETGMVAMSLEMRGEHEEAIRMLKPFAVCQGVKPLPGNFKSQEGLMYAAFPYPDRDTYTAQGYNMHHGWALWDLCEHYKWTRDNEYATSVASNLVAACDWITRERQATKELNPDGTKPVEWGLAPAGDLEDVAEYHYWYATNAYYYIGMKSAAKLLADIGHPDAERIRKDAEEFRRDLLASVMEAVATSPVVELKDGTWVPYVPPRAYVLTHRKEGWIREGLYPALHLLDTEVVEPHHPFMDWMLEDLEDNIFLSKESGYGVEDEKANFFDLGGFNLQPNLLPNAQAHLVRDEIPHFVRVFYNMFWASFWPDTVCFCEWVPDYGKSGGPLYKTPDECKFVQYMRNMLILEDGDKLKLGMGVPRAWMTDGKRIVIERAATFFGKMDMKITSEVASGKIIANLSLPTRNPAAEVFLRFRHPDSKKIARVTVDGKEHADFDADRELIKLPNSAREVVAYY